MEDVHTGHKCLLHFGMMQCSIGLPLAKIYQGLYKLFKFLICHNHGFLASQEALHWSLGHWAEFQTYAASSRLASLFVVRTLSLIALHHLTSIDSPPSESQIKVLSIHDLGESN